jgi:integrase
VARRNRSNGDTLLAYISSFFGTTPIVGVDDRLLEEFQDYLKSKGLKSSTVESYLNVIGAVLSQAVRERYLSENPLKLVRRVRAEEPVLEHLTIEELERLARTPIMGKKNLGGKIKRAFLFCCQTGLRWSDVRSLVWGEIKADASGNFQIAKRQVKTREPVYIPLSADAWGIINDGQDHPQDAHVFGIDSKSDPNQYLIAWGKAAGVQTALYFHLSRLTAATLLLEKGVDVAVVQKILGHTKIEMTLRYAKVTNQLKRQAVDSLKLNLGSGAAIDKAAVSSEDGSEEGQSGLAAKDN